MRVLKHYNFAIQGILAIIGIIILCYQHQIADVLDCSTIAIRIIGICLLVQFGLMRYITIRIGRRKPAGQSPVNH